MIIFSSEYVKGFNEYYCDVCEGNFISDDEPSDCPNCNKEDFEEFVEPAI